MSESPQTRLYAVGRIAKAYGIQGDVVVEPLTAEPNRFKVLKRALLGKQPEDVREVRIECVRVEPRGIRLRIAGVHDRNFARALAGTYLFVEEQHRIRVPKGTYFVDDIIGMNVVDQEGSRLGTVREVLKYPAHDVYVIAGEGTELMLPAVREFILKVDMKMRTITAKIIEGMVER